MNPHSSTQNANKNQKFFKKVSLVVAFLYTFGCIIPQASYASYEDEMMGADKMVMSEGVADQTYTMNYMKTMNAMTKPVMNEEAYTVKEDVKYKNPMTAMNVTETENTITAATTADAPESDSAEESGSNTQNDSSNTSNNVARAADAPSEETEVPAASVVPAAASFEPPPSDMNDDSNDTNLNDNTNPPPATLNANPNQSVEEARLERRGLREQIALEAGYAQDAINSAVTSIDDVIAEIKRFVEPDGASLADREVSALRALRTTLEAIIFNPNSSMDDQTNASMDMMTVDMAILHWESYIANQKEAIIALERSKDDLTGNCGSSDVATKDVCDFFPSSTTVNRTAKKSSSVQRKLERTGWATVAGITSANRLREIIQEIQVVAVEPSTVVATFDHDWDESQTSGIIRQGLMTRFN